MIPLTNPCWSSPKTILLATELPMDERLFAFALAQAKASGARLVLFHAYDTLVVAASETSGLRYYDATSAGETEAAHLEPAAERARATGIECTVVVRQGLAPLQILDSAREQHADRIVVGTRCPGHLGKILLGSVAEEVLRSAEVPVFILGPASIDQAFQGYRPKVVLCATSLHESCCGAVALAANVALESQARLLLLHVVKPTESGNVFAQRSLEQLEQDLISLVPSAIRDQLRLEPMVVPGHAADEILFQAKSQAADLLVLGAQDASVFSTLARHGVVYKVLAHATCPVLTLSPAALAKAYDSAEQEKQALVHHEVHAAGLV